MPAVFLDKPLFIVDAGPLPGVYCSREAYEAYCASHGFDLGKLFFDFSAEISTPEEPEDLTSLWIDHGGEG